MKFGWLGALLLSASWIQAQVLTREAMDAALIHDAEASGSVILNQFQGLAPLALGDFDGDGRDETAILLLTTAGWDVSLLPGGDWPQTSDLSTQRGLRIKPPDPNYLNQLVPHFADFNGDGRKDLFLYRNLIPLRLWGFLGGPLTGRTIDLSLETADFEISISTPAANLSSGDINGDGRDDLVIGQPTGGARGQVTIVWGTITPGGLINPADGIAGSRLVGPADDGSFGLQTAVADLDADGPKDLIISAPWLDPPSGTNKGITFGIFGTTAPWPAFWDTAVSTPAFRIEGNAESQGSQIVGTGDVNADGHADLLMTRGIFGFSRRMCWINGDDMDRGTVLSLPPDNPTDPTFDSNHLKEAPDFDMDGRSDFLVLSSPYDHADLWLSADTDVTHPSTPTYTVDLMARTFAAGDVDGDGRADVVLGVFDGVSPGPITATYYLIYGHRPLRNPGVQVVGRSAGGARLSLALSVEGNPTEMRLGGDIADGFRDQWIPFSPQATVTLTGATGPKTVTAVFRNARGRMSETASVPTAIAAGGPSVSVLRNRVGPDRPSEWEVTTTGGRLQAGVYDGEGRLVRSLESGDRPGGVWTVRWDGRNAEGRGVARGIYILAVETSNGTERLRVLVQ